MSRLKKFFCLSAVILVSACASITSDAFVPIALSFSDGSEGTCQIENKRMADTVSVPGTSMVKRSDDVLKFRCKTSNGNEAFGGIPSKIGGKIIASAVFLDLGITDAITDKHREYPASFVIPVKKK